MVDWKPLQASLISYIEAYNHIKMGRLDHQQNEAPLPLFNKWKIGPPEDLGLI